MALCVNQSGTWRSITTQCVNQSGTWRNITTGCINESGTWRCFGFFTPPALGSSFGGGRVLCVSSRTIWIVAPNTSEVSRIFPSRTDANTTAQSVSGCTGWFIPDVSQLSNPGYTCRTYWDSYSSTRYWSNTQYIEITGSYTGRARPVDMVTGGTLRTGATTAFCVRAFRCVTY